MKQISILCYCIIALAAVAAWAPNVLAMSSFEEAGAEGLSCSQCHPALANSGPGDANHVAHGEPTGQDCGSCHPTGFDNPPIGLNCTRCHGRAEDAGGDDISAGEGRGLRQHHQNSGASDCGLCHGDATGPPGVGEEVPPAFYPGVGAVPLDPCDGSEESFPSNTVSLDNDGDLLTDGADPDCVVDPCEGIVCDTPAPCEVGPGFCQDGVCIYDPVVCDTPGVCEVSPGNCVDDVCIYDPVQCPPGESCDPATGDCVPGDPCADFVPEPTTCGIGECASTGETTCDPNTGEIGDTCVPGDPSPEICDDGLDNDCDGLTDGADTEDCPPGEPCEGFVPEPTTCGVGECASTGETTCDTATGEIGDTCVPGNPSPEICDDGLDNDCDGATDGDDSDCIIDEKITLCHKGKNTLSVGAEAVSAHLAHGDTLGPCPD